jgi:hypothetical protein
MVKNRGITTISVGILNFSECRLRINSSQIVIAAGCSPSFSFRQPVAPCVALLHVNNGIVFPVELVNRLGIFIDNPTLCLI